MATINQTELLARGEPSGGTAMHWIGGQWLDSGEHRESINPATVNYQKDDILERLPRFKPDAYVADIEEVQGWKF